MQYAIMCRNMVEAQAPDLFESFRNDISAKVAAFNSIIEAKRDVLEISRTSNGMVLLKNGLPRHQVELYFEQSRPSIRVTHTVNLEPFLEPKFERQVFKFAVGDEYGNAVWLVSDSGKQCTYANASDLVLDRIAMSYPSSRGLK
jgi:hypothetical protein